MSWWRPLVPLLVLLLLLPIALLLLLPAGAKKLLTATPLATGKTMQGPRFRPVATAESGLDFTNELRPENRFTYLTNGAGLAVGDYDNDGLVDIYLVSQDGKNKLFHQSPALHFTDVTQAAGNVDGGAAWGTGAAFVDVDGDSLLDIYVCNTEAKNKLYRNLGDGTFLECAERFGLDLAGASTMAAFADVDRDGDLDLYLVKNRALHAGWALTPEVLNSIRPPADTLRTATQMVPTVLQLADPWLARHQPKPTAPKTVDTEVPEALRDNFLLSCGYAYTAGQSDLLLRNDGGHFVDVTKSAGMGDQGMGLSASFFDYDQDGLPDLYVANDLESADVLWHNEGNGKFRNVTKELLPHTAYYGMGSDSGDIDNDGRPDLIIGDMSATSHRMAKVLMGEMDQQRHFLIHSEPPQYMRNALLLNTGTGRFQEAAFQAGLASTDWTWSTLFGDLDCDGRLDLFCTNGIARFDMNPDIAARIRELWQQGLQQDAIALIKNVPSVPEQNLAMRNVGDLQFQKTGTDWGLDLLSVSHGAALVDLDRDGDLDVIVNNFNSNAVLYENVGARGKVAEVELHSFSDNPFGLGARVEIVTKTGRQMRELWSSRGYLSGQEPRLHFGFAADDKEIERIDVHWPSGRTQTHLQQPLDVLLSITEDLSLPIAAALAQKAKAAQFQNMVDGPAFTHHEREFDDYLAQPLLPHKLSQLGPGVAFGDADGDDQDELFCGGAAGQAGALLHRTAHGWERVPGPWDEDLECEDMGVLWFDYDGDGDQDLFVTSGGVEAKAGDVLQRDRLYRNLGNLKFIRDEQALPDLRESGSCVCAADFDGDGDLDLFVGGRAIPLHFPDAPPSRLLRNDGGRFVDVTQAMAPLLLTAGMVTGAVFSTISGDVFPDLLITAQWQPVRYLKNDSGTGFQDATLDAGLNNLTGWFNSITALDANGDGLTDFLIGNQGRNTKYKATPDHPLGLVYGDLDGSGKRNLVETKYEGDRLLPVRGRSCSSQAMPILKMKFPTYEQFASSLVSEIYAGDKLAAAQQLSANTLDSLLLISDSDGHFTSKPLPWRAQIAPLFGLAVADFDGDGKQAAVCGTNFFSAEPETGHFDGGLGLFLRGDGMGLTAIAPDASGIVAFGDQKGAAVSDLDGDGHLDFVIANNNGALQCYRNLATVEMLTVRLSGNKGNPTGVGSVIGVQRADGTTETRTIHAGDGYLSQSSAAVAFARGPSPILSVLVIWPSGLDTKVTTGLSRPLLRIKHP